MDCTQLIKWPSKHQLTLQLRKWGYFKKKSHLRRNPITKLRSSNVGNPVASSNNGQVIASKTENAFIPNEGVTPVSKLQEAKQPILEEDSQMQNNKANTYLDNNPAADQYSELKIDLLCSQHSMPISLTARCPFCCFLEEIKTSNERCYSSIFDIPSIEAASELYEIGLFKESALIAVAFWHNLCSSGQTSDSNYGTQQPLHIMPSIDALRALTYVLNSVTSKEACESVLLLVQLEGWDELVSDNASPRSSFWAALVAACNRAEVHHKCVRIIGLKAFKMIWGDPCETCGIFKAIETDCCNSKISLQLDFQIEIDLSLRRSQLLLEALLDTETASRMGLLLRKYLKHNKAVASASSFRKGTFRNVSINGFQLLCLPLKVFYGNIFDIARHSDDSKYTLDIVRGRNDFVHRIKAFADMICLNPCHPVNSALCVTCDKLLKMTAKLFQECRDEVGFHQRHTDNPANPTPNHAAIITANSSEHRRLRLCRVDPVLAPIPSASNLSGLSSMLSIQQRLQLILDRDDKKLSGHFSLMSIDSTSFGIVSRSLRSLCERSSLNSDPAAGHTKSTRIYPRTSHGTNLDGDSIQLIQGDIETGDLRVTRLEKVKDQDPSKLSNDKVSASQVEVGSLEASVPVQIPCERSAYLRQKEHFPPTAEISHDFLSPFESLHAAEQF